MADLVLSITYFGILLGLGIMVASVLKRHNIPDSFFLLLLGLLMGPTLYTNPYIMQYVSLNLVDVSLMGNIPDFLRLLALILVVFTGTFHLGIKAFKKVGNLSVNIAVVGVVFNTVVMGFVANMIFGFDLVYSFLMAAVLSGTGTSVVFAFEGSLKKAKSALNVIKVESILNSPLSVLLPIIFLDLVAIEPGAILEPMTYLSQFWVMIIAGAGAGLIIGLGISRILRRLMKEYTPLMLFAVALITFALAENVGGSGMLAVGVCGLIAGTYLRDRYKEIDKFDDHLSEMFRISVFTLLGAQVTLFLGLEEFLVIVMFFLIMFFIRPVYLFPVLGGKKKDFTRKEFLIMSFVTPRGLAAAAMAPIVAGTLIAAGAPVVADKIMNIIFLVIMLSVAFSTLFALLVKGRLDDHSQGKPRDHVKGKGTQDGASKPSKEDKDSDYLSVEDREQKQEESMHQNLMALGQLHELADRS